MRFQNVSLALLGASSIIAPAASFAPQVSTTHASLQLHATKSNNLESSVKNALSGVALATALWTAPATLAEQAVHFPAFAGNEVVASSIASAKEMASGTGSRVNKDAESLLRYGLPIDNKEVRPICSVLNLIIKRSHHNKTSQQCFHIGPRTPKEH